MSEEPVCEQVGRWREELVNLSRGNHLLYFGHTASTFEILRPGMNEVLTRLERGLAPADLVTDKPDEASLLFCLRHLERRAIQEFRDRGLWALFLGIGMLEWIDPVDRKAALSPLLLVPVTLERATPRDRVFLRRAADDPLVNPALAVKLHYDFGVDLPQLDDVEDLSAHAALSKLGMCISQHPTWRMSPRLVVSTFSFHQEVAYRDLLENEEQICAHPIVRALAQGPHEDLDFEPVPDAELDLVSPPEEAASVLDADASQRRAIAAAVAGHSFVIEGPPGTGKSQTISNIVSELLAREKTVLFVSDKAAALEVVHSRLEAAGLGEYVLELHSHKANRREVAEALGRALTLHPRSSVPMTDAARLAARRKELNDYARALNDAREPLGRSLHDVIGRVAELQSLPQAPVWEGPSADLDLARLSSILDDAAALGRAWGPVTRGEGFLWRDVEPTLSQRDVAPVLLDAREALEALAAHTRAAALETGLPASKSIGDALRLIDVLSHQKARPLVPPAWLSADLEALRARIEALSGVTAKYRELERSLSLAAGPNWASLNPSQNAILTSALRSLRATSPPWDLPQSATHASLSLAQAFLAESPGRLRAIDDGAAQVARAFGLPEEGVSLERASELADLGLLVGASTPPERSWLGQRGLAAAVEAKRVLLAVVKEFVERRGRLDDVFTDAVLALDLERLASRLGNAKGFFARLSRSYRADKRMLATATSVGKATKAAIARLPEAIEWQRVLRRLEDLEARHAAALGSYYDRDGTDVDALAAAIQIAERARDIGGANLELEHAARHLARGDQPEPGLFGAAHDLDRADATWRGEAASRFPDAFSSLEISPIHDVISWCVAAQEPLAVVLSVLEEVDAASGSTIDLATAKEILEWRQQAHASFRDLESHRSEDEALIGALYSGAGTDWNAVRRGLEWAEELRGLAGGAVDDHAADLLLTTGLGPEQLGAALAEWEVRREAVAQLLVEPRSSEVSAGLDSAFDVGAALLADLASQEAEIAEWRAFVDARDRLDARGLAGATAFCSEHRVPEDDVPKVIERSVLERWINDVLEADAELLGRDRDDRVQEFRDLDRALLLAARGRVVDACNSRRPRTTAGIAGIIQREAQGPHMSVRALLSETAPLALALKPCFMMSPFSVSHLLPPTMRFDAVVFDEASLLRPRDAVSCIYRGAQLIVAGDDQQLRPADGDSFLDVCKGRVPSLPLRCHYRSRHEALIAFSNSSFYGGSLMTFPAAVESGPDIGVELYHVDRVKHEASVVERVIHHARNRPGLSLGVVAFSMTEALAIEAELERRRGEMPDLDPFFSEDRLDGFFVKDVENVQGDERDIVVLSVGAGEDVGAEQDGCARRLNVAITRARLRLEIVSSMGPEDLGEPLREGTRQLRRYLEFAASRSSVAIRPSAESALMDEVARVVSSWGHAVATGVGSSALVDVAVRHPERPEAFALAIEGDGPSYDSATTARDRDRLRAELLAALGWTSHRIWSPLWFSDRAREVERLRAALDDAISGRLRPAVAPPPQAPPSPEVVRLESPPLEAPPEWTVRYEAADPAPPVRAMEMHDDVARSDLSRMVEEVVRVEAPVAEGVVLRRVREVWGFASSSVRAGEAFASVVAKLVARDVIRSDGAGFLWLPDRTLDAVRVPVAGDSRTDREVEEVPPPEIRLAALRLMEDVGAIDMEELTSSLCRVFGWARPGAEIGPTVEGVVGSLVAEHSGQEIESPA